MKMCILGVCLLVSVSSCHFGGKGTASTTDTVSFPNIQIYLEGQFKKMDSLHASLMLYGDRDSSAIGIDDARQLITPFMNTDENTSNGQYTRTVIQDSSHHRTIISFEAAGDSIPLNRVDVFLNSGSSVIGQLYIQYVQAGPDSSIRHQLIWKTDSSFTVITNVDHENQYPSGMRRQKVTWKLH
ncbi:MAG TPA: hypothetical protein VL547_19310 [Dinghuibacter sp.]|jgi:hypothetical protein|uniref:hypothetical protein n=1 Tax=Dinghuibacter sp. TaxID=2024697 RepID=UPI002BCB11BF|nr:hypothetical protein [Dinghuibacter sp.]HTJ14200.1 hypothetical protein [Dinghuibacter sp.]